jgi:predicted house-cleaning noncanonical NTP pyrophosphatase (MazG superfamily)
LLSQIAQSNSTIQSLEISNANHKAKCEKLTGNLNRAKSEIMTLKQNCHELSSQHRRQNEAEINHLVSIQKDLKSKLCKTIDVMKSQIAENESLMEKLTESTAHQRKQVQEIAQIRLSNKALELQIESLTGQANRDRDVLASQYRFKSLADDTKFQEELMELKAQHTREMNAVLLPLIEEFDELGGFTVDDLGTAAFQKRIRHIGQTYRNFLQNAN